MELLTAERKERELLNESFATLQKVHSESRHTVKYGPLIRSSSSNASTCISARTMFSSAIASCSSETRRSQNSSVPTPSRPKRWRRRDVS